VPEAAEPESDGYDESLRPGADANDENEDAATAVLTYSLLITGAIIFAAVFLVLFIKRRKLN